MESGPHHFRTKHSLNLNASVDNPLLMVIEASGCFKIIIPVRCFVSPPTVIILGRLLENPLGNKKSYLFLPPSVEVMFKH